MTTSRSNASIRKSTYHWIKKTGERFDEHDCMIRKFEREYDDREIIDHSLEPISILCIDGGGLRGYGALKMMEAVQDCCEDKGNFLSQFDLIAGTSVGGVMTLLLNSMNTAHDVATEASDCLDECRETAFNKMSVFNLLWKGKLVDSDNSLLKVFEGRYGSAPLKNPDGVPAVVTTISSSKGFDENREKVYQPLLLRTYDYPDDDERELRHRKIDLAESTSNVKLVEAMAATSAVPGLVDRVHIEIDGVKRSLADGFLFANDPTVVALNEARELYPRRPIGLVMSFGYDDSDTRFAQRAIAIARLSHPDLHYQRIAPDHLFKHFGPAETDLEKIALLEEAVYNYVITDTGVQRLLDVTLEKLFDNRQGKKWQIEEENGFFKNGYKSSIQDSVDYQRRTQERWSILQSSMIKSKRLQDYRKSVLGHLEQDGVYDLGQSDENNILQSSMIKSKRLQDYRKSVLGHLEQDVVYDLGQSDENNIDTFEDHEVSQNLTETVGFCCCRPKRNVMSKRDSTLIPTERMDGKYTEDFLVDKPQKNQAKLSNFDTEAEVGEIVVEHDSFVNGNSDGKKVRFSSNDENDDYDAKQLNYMEQEPINKINSDTNDINIGESSSDDVPKVMSFNITEEATKDEM